MSGKTNQTGGKSGVIGQFGEQDNVTLTGTQTLTNKTFVAPALGTPASGVISACTSSGMVLTAPVLGTPASGTMTNMTGLGAAALPSGAHIKISGVATSTNETSGTSQNAWVNSTVTAVFAPSIVTSWVRGVGYNLATLNNTTGDGGFSSRWKRDIAGGAVTYPTNLTDSEVVPNAHSRRYTNPFHGGGPTDFVSEINWDFIDDPDTTANITYTLQYATYNAEGFNIGGTYSSRWFIYFEEIKQ